MKLIVVTLALLCATTQAQASQSANITVETVNRLCSQKSKMCDAYFLGIKETLILATVTAAPGSRGGWFSHICMPRQGVSAGQIANVWQQYLGAHQVNRTAPAIFTVLDAAAWQWPCS